MQPLFVALLSDKGGENLVLFFIISSAMSRGRGLKASLVTIRRVFYQNIPTFSPAVSRGITGCYVSNIEGETEETVVSRRGVERIS